jgi:hypothetical protein
MEQFAIEVLKWILAKSDPMLIGCFLLLAVWQYRTSKLVAKHLDPKNKYPHPECEWGEKSYEELCRQLDHQHAENRADHSEIRALISGQKR